MVSLKNLPIIGKVLVVIALFAILAIASAAYSSNAMRGIGDSYHVTLAHRSKAALLLAEANRALNGVEAAMGELQMSTTDAGNQRAAASIRASRDLFVNALAAAALADPAKAAMADDFARRGAAIIDRTCAEAVRLGIAATLPPDLLAAQAEHLKSCGPAFGPLMTEMSAEVARTMADLDAEDAALTGATQSTILWTSIILLSGLGVVTLFGVLAAGALVSRPLQSLAACMQRIAAGHLEDPVPGTAHGDEIGLMARAVQVFRDNGVRLATTEAEAGRLREATERHRAEAEAARAAAEAGQRGVVDSLADGLDRLSNGDLTGRVTTAFPPGYEKLAADFNVTATSLENAMRSIAAACSAIGSGADAITRAADELSGRTEKQAASLERTAAAIGAITTTVGTTAAGAGEASAAVATARHEAEASSGLVREAVTAMGAIEHSSQEIGQIIGVIDEIAFQTNLLALNAGVEAARAGDAGRGFSVVAQEVRALSQRSAEAAKDIRQLISTSNAQVAGGVALVRQTGEALARIVERVAAIDSLVKGISSAAQQQASGLVEVDTAVEQMEQVVQRNAAMVEESTAAAHALKREIEALTQILRRFRIGGIASAPAPSNVHRLVPAQANPVHAIRAKLAVFAGMPRLAGKGGADHDTIKPGELEEF